MASIRFGAPAMASSVAYFCLIASRSSSVRSANTRSKSLSSVWPMMRSFGRRPS